MHSFAYQLAYLQYIFIIATANICFVGFCTTVFCTSTEMCNANNSFEFRMSWNRKLVILDSGNGCFRFVVRHSYCCCCCCCCGVCVPFFLINGWFAALTIHSFLCRFTIFDVLTSNRNGNETYHSFGTDVMYNRNARMRTFTACNWVSECVHECVTRSLPPSLCLYLCLFLFLVFRNTGVFART